MALSERPNLIEEKAEKRLNVPQPNAFEDQIYYNRYHNRKLGYTAGYTQATTGQSDTLTQDKEALKKLVELIDKIRITDTTNDPFEFTCKLSKAITKVEQLLYQFSKILTMRKIAAITTIKYKAK